MQTWSLYIIRERRGNLYTGITIDVKRRFKEHQNNPKKGAKFLRGKGPLKLVLKRKVGDKSLAAKLEYLVKSLSKSEKELLIFKKNHLTWMLTKLKNNY